MNTRDTLEADILALDVSDEPVVMVEVKASRPIDEAVKHRVVDSLKRATLRVPYVMLVDRQNIQIYEWNGQELSAPICCIPTADVLSHYEPDFNEKEIFEFYMVTLVEAWLRDIAYRWKSDVPPGLDKLAAIGLAQRLGDGTTVSASAGTA